MMVELNKRAAQKMYQDLLRQHLKRLVPGQRPKKRIPVKQARLRVQKHFGFGRATFFRYMKA